MNRHLSIKIFVPNGDPARVGVMEKSNWTSVAFNRTAFDQARERKEINKTCMYVLVEPSEGSCLPLLCVVEGAPVKRRLENHQAKIDFWTWAGFFVSKDGSLNKAHVKHLECRLIELAQRAKQANLDNQNTPQPPSLSEAEHADCESFLADKRSIFPLLGLSAFETPPAKPRPTRTLFLSAKGVQAQGYKSNKGVVIKQGRQAVTEENGVYTFTQNYTFSPPAPRSWSSSAEPPTAASNGRTSRGGREGGAGRGDGSSTKIETFAW